jgi:hypothetical protein
MASDVVKVGVEDGLSSGRPASVPIMPTTDDSIW